MSWVTVGVRGARVKRSQEKRLISRGFRKLPHKQHEALFLPYYTPSLPLSPSFFATMASTSMNRDVEAQQGILQPLGAASYHISRNGP
jgi:hypothetical protein